MIRKKSKEQVSEDESTDAKNRGGSACSSEEVSVMEMERIRSEVWFKKQQLAGFGSVK